MKFCGGGHFALICPPDWCSRRGEIPHFRLHCVSWIFHDRNKSTSPPPHVMTGPLFGQFCINPKKKIARGSPTRTVEISRFRTDSSVRRSEFAPRRRCDSDNPRVEIAHFPILSPQFPLRTAFKISPFIARAPWWSNFAMLKVL